MKLLTLISCLILSGQVYSQLPSVAVKVKDGARYDVNRDLRIGMELTGISREGFSADRFDDESVSRLYLLSDQLRVPYMAQASDLTKIHDKGFKFNDGHSSKPRWKMEVDGRVVRDGLLHPIYEVTTTYAKNKRIEALDYVFTAFEQFEMIPNREIGGGHIRVRVKKKHITPAQVLGVLRAYYSYQDFINFSFRAEKRSHNMAAPTLAAKFPASYPKWEKVLKTFRATDSMTVKELDDAGYPDPFFTRMGGFLKQVGIIHDLQADGYDKFLSFNLARLYRAYVRKDKSSLDFEFRLFNAPRDPREMRLHYKFISALFNLGLNELPAYEREYLGYARRWSYSKYYYEQAVDEMMEKLGLEKSEYQYLVELNSL